ncbi:MAG: hypothetical protein QOF84_5723 [Streptomyces sp.]|nr:hypothetical protein [Streptomyces sp.]
MARLVVKGEDLVVRLSWWEKAAARRRNVHVPLSAVHQVTVEPDWWRALRGEGVRGTWIPGLFSFGTRRHPGGEDFAAVRARRPVVCVELCRPSPHARLAVTDPDPEAAARAVRTATGIWPPPGAVRQGQPRSGHRWVPEDAGPPVAAECGRVDLRSGEVGE